MTATAIRRLGLSLALTAALLAAALVLIGRAGADDGDPLPAPTELRVTAERGSLDVALDWDDVPGADYYRVRWRPAGPDNKLNDGVHVQSSNAAFTVVRYGEWVARVQACDNAGCGAPAAKKFKVRRPRAVPDITPLPTATPTPLPTATPTPLPTSTLTPLPTATSTPEPTATFTPLPTSTPAPGTLQVSVTASAATAPVNQPVSLTASVSNAPTDSAPSYAWELNNGGGWFPQGAGPTLSYLTASPESWSFRVTVTYGSGISATSGALTVTWVEIPPTPTATSIPDPTATPIPEPTAIPTPEPTATPIPEPTATPTPEPSVPIPAKPAGLSVSAVPGSPEVSVDWDDVPGASYYWVRWRVTGSGNELNEGVAVLPSEAVIAVSGYGEWVARVQACNDSGCGAPAVSKFTVEPEPTATPTPAALRLGPALDGDGKLRPLTVVANWDPVPDAASHTLRWRRSNGEFQEEDRLTLDAAETSADFTVSEGGKYDVELQIYGDDNGLIAMESNQMEVHSYLRGHIFLLYVLLFHITGVEAYPVDGGVEVRWNKPRVSSITKYQYKALHSDEWHEYKSRDWTDAPGTGADTTSYTVTGLDAGETYAVWLRAVSENKTYIFRHYVIVTTPQYVTVDSSTFGTIDYDTDDDGLIEIASADQLNAIRWDLDGDGAVATDDLANYGAAFSGRLQSMGCPASGCKGYEIGTGAAGEAAITIDLDVAPYNTSAGWAPMGPFISVSDPYGFSAILEGNGNVIDNLLINKTLPNGGRLGLFDTIASEGKVRNMGLTNVNVTGSNHVRGLTGIRAGALAGRNAGLVRNCYSAGTVSVSHSVSAVAGGLVGYNRYGKVYASHSSASVAASNIVGGHLAVGGLIGYGWQAQVAASYATGGVTVTDSPAWYGGVGGLMGRNTGSSIRAGYSTGAVNFSSTGGVLAGGLVGENSWSYGSDGIVTDSYYNSETSGQSDSGKGIAKTTSELQAPASYTGIYANWNLDLNGDRKRDNPWNFGTSSEYPTLN